MMGTLVKPYSPNSHYATAPAAETSRAALAFDWGITILNVLFVGGLYLDGWAHNHGQVDQSFFTPWHAFFYGGFALVTLLLVGTLVVNRLRGQSWGTALPVGYRLSLLGVLIFATGGVGDLIWHELFGIEEGFAALLSPSHLTLILGLALVVTGPLRAAWSRAGGAPTWQALGPALSSLTLLISVLTFITMYAFPIAYNLAGMRHGEFHSDIGQMAGVLSVVVTTVLIMGPTLLVMRRWSLPLGSLLLVWGVNLVAMTILNWHHSYTAYQFGTMLLAIILADLLRRRFTAVRSNVYGLRVFAFLAPFLYMGAYFLALLLTEGTRWSIHLVSGTVVLAGATGWLLSYLVVGPEIVNE
jgi:hypothetical protein